MFKKFIIVVLLSFLYVISAQANYHLGMAAFEKGEYQEAYDLMKPIAEKGGTYVVAYMEHIQNKKLISNAEFQLPVEIPQSIRQTSDEWLEASLLYRQIREALEGYVYVTGSITKAKKKKKSKKKSKKGLELPGNTLKKLKSLNSMRGVNNYRAAILMGKLIKSYEYLLNADFIKEKSLLDYNKKTMRNCAEQYMLHPDFICMFFECKRLEKKSESISKYLMYLLDSEENEDSMLAFNEFSCSLKSAYACILREQDLGHFYYGCVLDLEYDFLGLAFESGYTDVADRFHEHPILSKSNDWKTYCYQIMQKLHSETPSSPLGYAQMLHIGDGGAIDDEAAFKWAEIAYDNGKKQALTILARLYTNEDFKKKDFVKARSILLEAIKLDNNENKADNMYQYACMCIKGQGGEVNYAQALTWANAAYRLGSINALHLLGLIYGAGYGVEKDLVKARQFYKECAERSKETGGHYNYALMCYYGQGGTIDYAQAFKYAYKACKSGDLEAVPLLARMYQGGQGVGQNLAEARKLFRKHADESQNTSSCYNYAVMCLKGKGGKIDYAEAFKYASIAYQNGGSNAPFLLAIMYENGLGAKKELVKARELYLEVINGPKQNSVAYFLYAQMYLHGHGGEKDIDEALKMSRLGLRIDVDSAYAHYCHSDILWNIYKQDEGAVDEAEFSDSLNKAISMGSANALLLKRQFEKYKRQKIRLIQQDSDISGSEQDLDIQLDEEDPEAVMEIKFPDLEDPYSDGEDSYSKNALSVGDIESEDEESAFEYPNCRQEEEATVLDAAVCADMMKGMQSQWEVDRKRKQSKKYRQWCEQSIEVNPLQLQNNRIDGMENDRQFVLPLKLDIRLLYAIFGLNAHKFHNYTPLDAMQLFASFGCNVGVEGESFHIEYKDKDGIIHKFSSHMSHGHGKENKLYRPTNLYLKRFCNTIGLTKKVVEDYQA